MVLVTQELNYDREEFNLAPQMYNAFIYLIIYYVNSSEYIKYIFK